MRIEIEIMIVSYYIHPLFRDIESNFRYFLVSAGTLTQKKIQERIYATWPTMNLTTTVTFDGNNVVLFDVKKTLAEFNDKFGVTDDGKQTTAQLDLLLETQARLMAIYAFDSIRGSIYEDKMPSKLINFLYHIRNGAAHNNKFRILSAKIEAAEWRGKTIGPSLHEQPVFNSFICPADVVVLLIDISAEMKKLDELNV